MTKNYLYVSAWLFLLFSYSIDAKEYSAREYRRVEFHLYSIQELSKSGQEWIDFCHKQKTLLSAHEDKFASFDPYPQKEGLLDNEYDDFKFITVGGLNLSLPIKNQMRFRDAELKEGSYYYFALRSDEETISIERTKITEIDNLWNEKEVGSIELTRKLFPEGGITEISLVFETYSLTPSDLQCVLSNENADKRVLIYLGLKSKFPNIIKLNNTRGYAKFGPGLKPGSVSMDLVYELNSSVYRVFYHSAFSVRDENYIRSFIANIVYPPDVESYRVSVDAEFKNINEQLAKIKK